MPAHTRIQHSTARSVTASAASARIVSRPLCLLPSDRITALAAPDRIVSRPVCLLTSDRITPPHARRGRVRRRMERLGGSQRLLPQPDPPGLLPGAACGVLTMISTAAAPPWGDPIGSRYPQMAAPSPSPRALACIFGPTYHRHKAQFAGRRRERSLILELLLIGPLIAHALPTTPHSPPWSP